MPDLWMDVDTALTEVPVNILPLLDDGDFKTREIAIAYNAAGMDLVWNFVTTAGVFTQTAVTPTTAGDYDWTHLGDGMYTIEIPASGGASINNDTEGFGWFSGLVTGVLPWRGPVIGFRAAALNNALVDGGDVLDVNLTEIGGVAQSATDLKDFADAGYDPATNKVQGVVLVDTTTTNSDMRGTDGANTTTPPTAAAIADAVWDEAKAGHVGAGSFGEEVQAHALSSEVSALNDPSAASIADAVWDEAKSGHVGAGSFGEEVQAHALSSEVSALNDPTAAAIADAVWDEAKSGHAGAGSFGEEVQAHALSTEISALENISEAQVKAQADAAIETYHLDHLLAVDYDPASKPGIATALLNELVESDGGVSRFTANALEQAPGGSSSLPSLLQNTTIATLTSQTVFTLTAGSSDNDAYNNMILIVTDSATSEQKAVGIVLDYVGSTKEITLTADPGIFTMAVGDTVDIIATSPSTSPPTAAAIADAVWDEAKAGHVAAGSFGEEVQAHALSSEVSALNDPTAAAIADAVWDEAKAGHVTAGTFGEEVQTHALSSEVSALNDPSAAAIADAVWDEALAGHAAAGSTGEALANAAAPTAAAIADAVWDEAIADHLGVGSTGEALSGATAPTAAAVADAVWDEAKAGHVAAGSFGEEVQAHALSSEVSALNDPTAAAIADAVWDEALADHLGVGSMGEALNAAGGGATPAAIADAVWDEALADHLSAGSTGATLAAAGGVGSVTAVTYTHTVTDGSNPIPGASVWITTDAAGSNTVWSGTTDAFGVSRDVAGNKPFLDPGDYYFFVQREGYTGTTSELKTVS